MRIRLKPNYLLLTVAFAFFWSAVNLLYIISQIYSLNNSFIVDTSTALQSLKSVYFSKPFLNTVPSGSYFSVHASEFLYLLLPGFTLFQSFLSLYIMQLVITYAAAIPLFLLAKKLLNDERSAFFLALVYIFFPYINNNPFELLTLFMGLIIFSFYFLETGHYIAFSISFVLALSTMEFAPLIGISIGLYLLLIYLLKVYRNSSNAPTFIKKVKTAVTGFFRQFISSNSARLAIALIIFSAIFYFADSSIISFFSSGSHHITENLDSFGTGIFPTIPSKIESVMEINAPMLFLSFIDPLVLLELPWIVASGITSFSPYWSNSVYYDSYLIPFVVISAIYGLKRFSNIVSDKRSRTRIVRVLSGLALLVSIIILVSTSVIPMDQGFASTQTSKGADVAQLAALIPANQSVFTGANELPIVSMQAWNTWIYGPQRNYTLFNASNGEPYNLSHDSLVAASGPYVLLSKTYHGQPVFNNFYVAGNALSSQPFQSYESNFNLLVPPGNYTINLNVNYTPVPTYMDRINAGRFSYAILPENYALIQPFSVSVPTNIVSINVPAQMYPGYYILQSMITQNMSTNSQLGESSMGRNQYNTPSLTFEYPSTSLLPNTTYYFWLWSSGVPGGLYIPATSNATSGNSDLALIYNGTGTDSYGYYFSSYSDLSKNKYGLQFTITGTSVNSSISKVHPTTMDISLAGSLFNVSLTGHANLSYNIHLSEPQQSGLILSSPFLNGVINGISFTIFSDTYSSSHHKNGFISIITWLGLIFLSFCILILISFLEIPIKKNFRLYKISRFVLIVSTLGFFSTFAISYYTGFFIFTLLQVLSVLIFTSLFLVFMFSDLLTSDNIGNKSFLSTLQGPE